MVSIKIALLFALCCIAASQRDVVGEALTLATSVTSTVTVSDKYSRTIAKVDVNVDVFGAFNQTTDSQVVSDLVQNKISSIQIPSEEKNSYLAFSGNSSLPLAVNVTGLEYITLGPSPRSVGVEFSVVVYAQSHHHQEALSAIKAFKPSF